MTCSTGWKLIAVAPMVRTQSTMSGSLRKFSLCTTALMMIGKSAPCFALARVQRPDTGDDIVERAFDAARIIVNVGVTRVDRDIDVERLGGDGPVDDFLVAEGAAIGRDAPFQIHARRRI